MANETKIDCLGQLPKNIKSIGTALTSLLTLTTTLIASLLFYWFTDKKADLQYEILSVTNFQAQNVSYSIVNIRIANAGKKEVNNVNGVIELNVNGKIIETNTALSSKAIEFTTVRDTANVFRFKAPLLNQGEQATLSFFANCFVDLKNINVDLRGAGIVGRNNTVDKIRKDEVDTVLYIATAGMLIVTICLIIFIIFHQRKVIRSQLQLQVLEKRHNKRIFDKLKEMGIDVDELKKNLKDSGKGNPPNEQQST